MPSDYKTYTFKCHKTHDRELIRFLDNQPKNERSGAIRDAIRLGKRIPRPAKAQPVNLEILRAELAKAVDEILDSIPRIPFGDRDEQEKPPKPPPLELRDVNDKGKNIPDF